ncbi:15067_t:CDS:2 [Acaulospora morrowiae]|uniref:15067_t:CDS:1 n=1 Tax=Acaulospora morrowiae TaxID=94023 RepID=A0A9N8ZV36_9GLOM|nr:15067_t:CDS:2 [Acaulospora morrowiae]
MGTTQLNSEFGETFAEKNAHPESKVEQNTTNKHGNESGSEPEIYLLVSHRGRRHDHRGGRRIGLFGPFGPRGPKVEMRGGVRRGPPHARGFRHEEFVETSEGERGHSPHRGMRRFGPGPHEKRGPSLERGSEFHREPRHHGDSSHRPHGFGPRGGPRGRFETEEHIHHPREHGRGPRGGPRDRFETEEHIHHPREHGRGPRGGPRDRFETEEHIHHPREHGRGPRGGHRDRVETEEHGHRPRGGRRDGFENEERIHHLPREHGHGPRERFEAEENVKQLHRRKPEDHEHSPHRYGHGHHRRFNAERSTKEFHGLIRSRNIFLILPNAVVLVDMDLVPVMVRDLNMMSTALMDGPESDHESENSRKSFNHHGGHRFGNGHDFRGRHRLGRGGPRLHHHVPRHRMPRGPRFPHHHHHRKPLTPEELAEKVALLNSMGFPAEKNSHYEELLKKFNGRIGRVIEILLRERKKEEDDKNKGNDDENGGNEEDDGNKEEGDGNEEEGDENEDEKTPVEDYDIVE